MFRKLVGTHREFILSIVRLVVGVIFFYHGAQKMLGWFGGMGFVRQTAAFEARMHFPAVIAVLPTLAEFFGGLGLIVGFLTRIAAFGLFCDMIVAMALVTGPNGLSMNWSGRQAGEGIEFSLMAVAIMLLFMVRGGGALSLDYLLQGSGSPRSTVPAPLEKVRT